MFGNYSVFHCINEWQKNRPVIEAYLSGQKTEGFGLTLCDSGIIKFLGIPNFIAYTIVTVLLWVFALIMLVIRWKVLGVAAKILGVTGLVTCFGGPIMTLVAVFVGSEHVSFV